jgi:NAD-dependent deacetylase
MTPRLPIPLLDDSQVFVLTGAGISAESGLATFAGGGGLWAGHDVNDVATRAGFLRNPAGVWRFYSELRQQAAAATPNRAHRALAAFEAALGPRLFLCTQNVDGLHEAAGSQNLIHLHGELTNTCCTRCNRDAFDDPGVYFDGAPTCNECGGLLRPDICWFGELPYALGIVYDQLALATHLIAVGSSGSVHPAAGFARDARRLGHLARAIYVGLERPENADDFDQCVLGNATDLVPQLFALA